MKKLFNYSFILLAMIGVMFTSCRKDYDTPPIQDLPIGTVYTIGDILGMESGTVFSEDASVYGIVTADEVSGNLYKTAFMQDRATGDAIELYMSATSGVRIGDSIRVYLKGITYAMYNNLPQLSNFEADGHIVILANDRPIQPAVTTIANITAGQHLAGLVKLENVMFTEQNTFADATGYGNRTLVDPANYSQTVIVRTSNYANFANDSLPQGTGNLIAIAAVYNSTWQLYIRSAKELEFEGYTPGSGAQGLPYYQDFASSFGSYTTYDVAGAQSWEIDYNTAKMTGYASSTNFANEDWLISSQVSLEGVSSVNMTMTYIARYFNDLNNDITVQVSTDYTSGDPTMATWTNVPATWTSGSDWNNFTSTTIDLSQFAGQKVNVAVKYLSTDEKAGTIEVQSILLQEGGVTPPTPPTPGGEVQSMPYTQSFATEFGTYMTYDVLGAESWEIDYSTAKMTGYVGGVNNADEDWLISSPVAITGVNEAKMSMTYIARYFANLNSDITVQVSNDYVWGNDPTTAAWTNVPATWTSGSDWSTFATTEVDLTQFVGQTVTVAVKYLSTETKAGTIEVQSITIQEGGGVTPPTPPTPPGPGAGSGTAADPYNVASGISMQGQEIIGWVHGYIVGAVKSGLTSVSSNADINWAAPFDLATNVLIADDPSCNEVSQCVIVNLPSGKPLRTQVNLMDNPDNLGKVLAVNGKLRTYFGQAGLRDSGGTENDFVLEGYVPPTPPTPGTGILNETFAAGQGDFVIKDVNIPEGLTYVWAHASQYQCMKGSGYYQQAYNTESWLVSPIIDLSDVTTATLSFDHAVNYLAPQGSLFVMISTNYNGDVNTATWNEVNLSAWPAGTDFTFVSTTADLSAYAGQQVTIAFKYTSTAAGAATWEVKNFLVAE